jgi:hypothetical protein
MASSSPCRIWLLLLIVIVAHAATATAQSGSHSPQTAGQAASQTARKTAHTDSLDPGTVTNSLYRNKTLGFTCKIPPGWVLRTDEMNTPDEPNANDSAADSTKTAATPASSAGGKVLLAAFSRPPEATGEDVNGSILIAAESQAAYPGLKDAAQYLEPLTEVAKAQGFNEDEDPYELAIGTKTLVRGDFHKNVATRVMRQSTLAMLSHGYAVSFTVIAGTDEEVQELIDGLDFTATAGAKK